MSSAGPGGISSGSEGRRAPRGDAYVELRKALGGLAEVRAPGEAEEPILAPGVRAWLHAWMTEIRAVDDLAAIGLRARASAVLHGPPGCGKTTLAHHLAARLGLPLVLVGPETLFGAYVGESEGNTGRLFTVLRSAKAPCVLFIDEIEAIGRKRSSSIGGGSEIRNNVLTILLRKMEEYEGYFLGATNRPGDLDPALWRRFQMQLGIELPQAEERFAIIRRYAHPFDFSDADVDLLVELTAGASPALLRNLMEGVKRALVINPKIGKGAARATEIFEAVIASVQPPPEMERPPLWDGASGALADLAWPPARLPA